MSCFQPCGKAGAALKQFPKRQLRLFPAKAVKFQIQDCAGAPGTDFQPMRCICRQENKLICSQCVHPILTVYLTAATCHIHDLTAVVRMHRHMILRE